MKIVILGCGGHAGVLKGVLTRGISGKPEIIMIQPDSVPPPHHKTVIGIGDLGLRKRLFEKYPLSMRVISMDSTILTSIPSGDGVQVMAGAVIQVNVSIGDNTLINTGASIDHDSVIGRHCHIAPGVVICGGVTVGDGSFIGAGSIIAEGVKIPENSFVPAGSLIGKNGYKNRYAKV